MKSTPSQCFAGFRLGFTLLSSAAVVGVSVGLSGSAFAILPQEISVPSNMRESVGLPRPGEIVLRTPSVESARESMLLGVPGGAAVSVERDSIDGSLRLATGELGLSLADAFGSESNFQAWVKASSKGEKGRQGLLRVVNKAVLRFVAEKGDALGFQVSDLQLNENKFFADSAHTFVSYDVVLKTGVGGAVKVKGTSIDFRFTGGELTQIAARSFGASRSEAARQAALAASTSVSADDALARRVLGPEAKVEQPSVPLVHVNVSEDGRSYVFTPARRLDAKSATGELFYIIASAEPRLEAAQKANVLEWNSLHLNVSARVHGVVNNRSVNDGQSTIAFAGIQGSTSGGGVFGRRTTFTADADGNLVAPSARELVVSLASPIVKVAHSTGTSAAVRLTSDADVLFDANSNSTLAETTTFYHTQVVRNWAKKYVNVRWFDQQLTANVNIGDICNAFWNGRTINFFQSGSKSRNGRTLECNNTGEIADVVYHEWGHGLDHNTGGIDDGAYSEGIGDIVSMLITDSSQVGPGFFKDGSPVRDLEGEYSYPKDKGEVHKEGLIIGSTWWHLTRALVEKYGNDVGRETASRYFLKSLFTTSQYTDVYKALLTIDAEDAASAGRGPNACLINAAFSRHGLATKDASCQG